SRYCRADQKIVLKSMKSIGSCRFHQTRPRGPRQHAPGTGHKKTASAKAGGFFGGRRPEAAMP
ncbi:hypothetical protein NO135_20850, partial [Clostridioides difficile]|nr:hypothetical protein [Clostridioides difficile]